MSFLYSHAATFSASRRVNWPDHPASSLTGSTFRVSLLLVSRGDDPPDRGVRDALYRFDHWLAENWDGRVLLQRNDTVVRAVFDALARDHGLRRPFYLEDPPSLNNLSAELHRVAVFCLTDPREGEPAAGGEANWRLQRVQIENLADGRRAQALLSKKGEGFG